MEVATFNRFDRLRPYLWATMLAIAAALLCLPFRSYLNAVEVLLFLLIAIVGIALRFDSGPSIAASVTAFLAFNMLFTQPYYRFTVHRTGDVLALFTFLGLAILISQLLVRIRLRTSEALLRGRQTETLYRLSVALIRDSELDSILQAIVERVVEVFDLNAAAALLRAGERLQSGAETGARLDLTDRNLLSVARHAIEQGRPIGVGTRRVRVRASGPAPPKSTTPHELLVVPIMTAERALGVLVVARERGRRPFDDEESRLLGTFANQAALAIERSLLEEQRARAELLARTDELKTALLSAVSHDLRTPLASIKASVTTLMQPDVVLSDEDRYELLVAIDEESDRLNRLVANLLDLSRIEAGALKPVREWYPIAQIVREAADRCELLLGDHPLSIAAPDTLLVDVDYVMIAEVLANLIENAAKYSPPAAPIAITAELAGDLVEVRVSDVGVGVAAGEEERIFDKFYRVEARNRPLGSGIGLAICKGFVEAHGGRIWVERNPSGGSTFAFIVPAAPENSGTAAEQAAPAQPAELSRP